MVFIFKMEKEIKFIGKIREFKGQIWYITIPKEFRKNLVNARKDGKAVGVTLTEIDF